MSPRTTTVIRVTSVIAASLVALACGTNYAYSAWAVHFGKRMKFNSTQVNLIGTFANLGMYICGVPVGLLVDARGPRPGAVLGATLLGVGYAVPYIAFQQGPGSVSLGWLCFFMFLSGAGGCAAFSGAIKICALNWPNHRGTATSFPLAAFGLSAFFFSLLSSIVFPDDTSSLLLLLAILTFLLPLIGSAFLHIVPTSHDYAQLGNEDEVASISDSSLRLKRTNSESSIHSDATLSTTSLGTHSSSNELDAGSTLHEPTNHNPSISHSHNSQDQNGSHMLDIRGLAMLRHSRFWQLWIMMGLFTGIGLMTINNIGNNAQTLWHHYDDTIPDKVIQAREVSHVEVISLGSFLGRILSGIGSDVIVGKYHLSRFYCPLLSALIFCFAQICGTQISNPHSLFLLSGSTGLAYGFLFGCYPALVAETFGVHGLSQNWGFMTLGPVIGGNVFNLLYGRIYDSNSADGDCTAGLICYRSAYGVTLFAAFCGLGVSLWSVRKDRNVRTGTAGATRIRGRTRERVA